VGGGGGICLSFHDAVAEEPGSLYPTLGPAEGPQSGEPRPAGLGQAAWWSPEPIHLEG